MAKYEVRLPKMGESVIEATLNTWLVQPGDEIEVDDAIVEVSTDKVDTEIPSEVKGVLLEQRFAEGDVVKVGEVMAVIETSAVIEDDDTFTGVPQNESISVKKEEPDDVIPFVPEKESSIADKNNTYKDSSRFYSPLVKSIAREEGISREELDGIPGTGKNGRLTKNDILAYLKKRHEQKTNTGTSISKNTPGQEKLNPSTGDILIPLDRMGRLIAKHMAESKRTSAHVQSFIEIDVTHIVHWRNKVKEDFMRQTGEKLTYTPVFMQAVAQVIKEFPMVNVQFDGENIIVKKAINLGMAAALPDGNLIVPVIKNADDLSLTGMVKAVNRLAKSAREGKLSPDDISGGTYTVTNVGTFGSITGTPIINQPQVAILALGAIRKMPAVIETPEGDSIGIRHKMIVAHSYDHRVINGALGGQFILRLKEILEDFSPDTPY